MGNIRFKMNNGKNGMPEQPIIKDKKIAHLHPLRSLWPWIAPHKRQLGLALVAIVAIAAALLSMGQGVAYLVDSGLNADSGNNQLNTAVLVCLAITALLALGSYFRVVLINRVAERVVTDIRKSLFRHVLGLSEAWFESARVGQVLSTFSTDIVLIQTVTASTLSMAMRNILVLVGGIIFIILTSPKLTLIILGVIPLVIVPVVLLGRKLRTQSRLAQDRLADISVEAEEALTAIQTVHAFSREDLVSARFNTAAEASYTASVKRLVLRGLLSGIVIFLVFSAIAFILWIGGQDLLSGAMSAGELSAFVFYAALVASSVGALSDVMGELQRAAGAADRISALLAQVQTIKDPLTPKPLPSGGLSVAFNDVSFAYESKPDIKTLSHIDFMVQPAERIALVGPSGAGKSTILNLILRLNDTSSGSVMVGGTDIRELSISDLRKAIGFVPQETTLFSGTILDNISFGDPDADFAQIRGAAEQAYADDFIMGLPHGYDTMVGEKGVRLSGGERQRIAIARAILRNPRILLLDEATSALDAKSEQLVQAALENLMVRRTTIVIAHRLATVINSDRIIVLNNGSIAAFGTHDELLATSPLYHDLASLQLLIDD